MNKYNTTVLVIVLSEFQARERAKAGLEIILPLFLKFFVSALSEPSHSFCLSFNLLLKSALLPNEHGYPGGGLGILLYSENAF